MNIKLFLNGTLIFFILNFSHAPVKPGICHKTNNFNCMFQAPFGIITYEECCRLDWFSEFKKWGIISIYQKKTFNDNFVIEINRLRLRQVLSNLQNLQSVCLVVQFLLSSHNFCNLEKSSGGPNFEKSSLVAYKNTLQEELFRYLFKVTN